MPGLFPELESGRECTFTMHRHLISHPWKLWQGSWQGIAKTPGRAEQKIHVGLSISIIEHNVMHADHRAASYWANKVAIHTVNTDANRPKIPIQKIMNREFFNSARIFFCNHFFQKLSNSSTSIFSSLVVHCMYVLTGNRALYKNKVKLQWKTRIETKENVSPTMIIFWKFLVIFSLPPASLFATCMVDCDHWMVPAQYTTYRADHLVSD